MFESKEVNDIFIEFYNLVHISIGSIYYIIYDFPSPFRSLTIVIYIISFSIRIECKVHVVVFDSIVIEIQLFDILI